MKLTVPFVVLASLIEGFVPQSQTYSRSRSSLQAIFSHDPYAPLLAKLDAASSTPSITSTPIDDTHQKLLDTLTQTLETANNALLASSEVSNIRFPDNSIQPLPFMLDAQEKLSSIEQQLHDIRVSPSSSSEVDVSTLLVSLHSVLDTSIQAADHAVHSSTEMVDTLVGYNLALSHSLGLLPSNVGEMIHTQFGQIVDGLLSSNDFRPNVDWSNDANLQVLSMLDRKLDGLEVSQETVVAVVGYGIVAFLLGYAQNVGMEEYKLNLRNKMENGDFNVEEVCYYLL